MQWLCQSSECLMTTTQLLFATAYCPTVHSQLISCYNAYLYSFPFNIHYKGLLWKCVVYQGQLSCFYTGSHKWTQVKWGDRGSMAMQHDSADAVQPTMAWQLCILPLSSIKWFWPRKRGGVDKRYSPRVMGDTEATRWQFWGGVKRVTIPSRDWPPNWQHSDDFSELQGYGPRTSSILFFSAGRLLRAACLFTLN